MGGQVGRAHPHDAARLHVQGSAPYTDDIPMVRGTLHAAVGTSPVAHGRLKGLELGGVMGSDGVVGVVAADSVPGDGNIGPVLRDENVFASAKLEFFGQVIFAVAADTMAKARRAARNARLDVVELPPVLTIEEAMDRGSYIIPKKSLPVVEKDWSRSALRDCPHVVKGTVRSGAQEHFYLEGQVAYAIPQEDGQFLVHSSTQHPSEVQHVVAGVLGLPLHMVEVRVRRMGGGFGGKETNGAQPAAIAALLAARTKRPVKLRLPRGDDFLVTGKRHPFKGTFAVGFDDDGRIQAADIAYMSDCGCSADLSLAILDRAILHADNCYHLPRARIRGYPCRTNKVSNTAFRGFGGPQGMLPIERAIEDIARCLGLDAYEVRRRNLYRGRRQRTPYGQAVADNILPELSRELADKSSYMKRRKAVDRFNSGARALRRGIALTPVKFGISFTVTHLNQAGAVVSVYRDGTVSLDHGGTEMGQGLFIKVAQVVADVFGLPLSAVRPQSTSTARVPNTSATAASAGSDLNGMASMRAADTIRKRLASFAAAKARCSVSKVSFTNGKVKTPRKTWDLGQLASDAYMARVPLSATGYYRTPELEFDPVARKGDRPFFYFAYGAAVSEVEVDTLTGEHSLLRVDILHDIGNPINPAVDMGQVEGGYAQGYGWLTCEELMWDGSGRPLSLGPATYKIPAVGDMPPSFNVSYWTKANRAPTVHRSKAVGEPPLMLAISAWAALMDAVSSVGGQNGQPVELDAPATPERVLLAIMDRKE